MGSHHGHNV